MKPAPFDYRAPRTLDEVFEALAEDPFDVTVLAGGQSLVPLLNLRLARPRLLVDLNGVEGLAGIEVNGHVRIGAMVRQRKLELDRAISRRLPLLAEAASHIAHIPIRTRGTVGGSLAHADPSAELPVAVAALTGRIELLSSSGTRVLPANEFFLGPLTTGIEAGEIVAAVQLDPPPARSGSAFVEVTRTHGAFALVAAAAVVETDGAGSVVSARLALGGVGGTPHVATWVDQELRGERADPVVFARVRERIWDSLDPYSDSHASGEYRRRVAGVLAERALAKAAQRAGAGGGA